MLSFSWGKLKHSLPYLSGFNWVFMQFANLPLCLQYHLGLVNTDIAMRMEARYWVFTNIFFLFFRDKTVYVLRKLQNWLKESGFHAHAPGKTSTFIFHKSHRVICAISYSHYVFFLSLEQTLKYFFQNIDSHNIKQHYNKRKLQLDLFLVREATLETLCLHSYILIIISYV